MPVMATGDACDLVDRDEEVVLLEDVDPLRPPLDAAVPLALLLEVLIAANRVQQPLAKRGGWKIRGSSERGLFREEARGARSWVGGRVPLWRGPCRRSS